VELTPWDIDSDDLKAMPANGRAITADNQEVDLISAGLMAVAFYDEAGNALNLAEGKTATLQMSLPFSSIDGHDLSAGGAIPMWYFNESLGLWEETPDVKGSAVVVTRDGEKMLMVEATVPHFSSWNWDFKYESAGSTFLQCLDPASKPIACSITASVVLTDGSKLVKNSSIGAEGATVYNMPDRVKEITWEATGASAESQRLMGKVKNPLDMTGAGAALPGSISISLSAPYQYTAQCLLPDSVAVACKAKIALNGSAEIDEYSLPAEGAAIYTQQLPQQANWSAYQYISKGNGEIWKYTGEGSNVSLSENKLVMTFATPPEINQLQYSYVRCNPQAYDYNSGENVAIAQCDVTLMPQGRDQIDPVEIIPVTATIPTGVIYPISLRVEWLDMTYQYFNIQASNLDTLKNSDQCYFQSYDWMPFDDLLSHQIHDLSLNGYCGIVPMR
jgi:hypothetical protein